MGCSSEPYFWKQRVPRFGYWDPAVEPANEFWRGTLPGWSWDRSRAGCYWQRLKHFEGTPDGIIESGWLEQSADIPVSIRSTDVGFLTSDACGTWTRVS
jgi:hypothetical protein